MPISESCTSKQTFCVINGQSVKDNSNINFSYKNICVSKGEILTPEIYNQVLNELVEIYNYGSRGTRNPNLDDNTYLSLAFQGQSGQPAIPNDKQGAETNNTRKVSEYTNNNKNKLNFIQQADYNNLLTLLSLTNLNGATIITSDFFEKLKNNINDYQLDPTRCNNCNSGCNTYVEYCGNCSECDCGDCAEGGGCSGCGVNSDCYGCNSVGGDEACGTSSYCTCEVVNS